MRQKLPSPIRPFDRVPLHVVDAAKRIFEPVVTGRFTKGLAEARTAEWSEPFAGQEPGAAAATAPLP